MTNSILVSKILHIAALALTHPWPFPLPISGEGREKSRKIEAFLPPQALGEGAGDEGAFADVQDATDQDRLAQIRAD